MWIQETSAYHAPSVPDGPFKWPYTCILPLPEYVVFHQIRARGGEQRAEIAFIRLNGGTRGGDVAKANIRRTENAGWMIVLK